MEDTDLFEKVQGLTDVELAVLLSLVAGQQCLIETDQEAIQPLSEELQLVSNQCHYYPVNPCFLLF